MQKEKKKRKASFVKNLTHCLTTSIYTKEKRRKNSTLGLIGK